MRMKYKVRATERNFLEEIELEADSGEEAKKRYREKWEKGEVASDDCELEITMEKLDGQ